MDKQTELQTEEVSFSADTDALEKKIGHAFKDQRLLREALTHSTYAHEMKQKRKEPYVCNERLEFLGF